MYERFAELLKINRTTTADVSRATGISNGHFSDWKNGRCTPKGETLMKIAKHFGVSVDYLLGNDGITDTMGEAWGQITADPRKYDLALWLATLSDSELDRLTVLLHAAMMKNKE